MSDRLLVVVPTHNEARNIGLVLDGIRSAEPTADVVVVDDASGDGTRDVVRSIADDDRRVHLICRSQKLGLGTAYVGAFRWALERGYDRVAQMDADLSHDPGELPRLARSAAELAIGSRYVAGGTTPGWSRRRRFLSRGGGIYARLALGLRRIADPTSGFRCYRRSLLERISLDEVVARGFGFQIEMTYRARRAHASIVEVPIAFAERRYGTSKMSFAIAWEALLLPFRLRAGARARAPIALPDPERS
jgi:dolichol-phosphate mannosyltransferase